MCARARAKVGVASVCALVCASAPLAVGAMCWVAWQLSRGLMAETEQHPVWTGRCLIETGLPQRQLLTVPTLIGTVHSWSHNYTLLISIGFLDTACLSFFLSLSLSIALFFLREREEKRAIR